MFKNLKGSPLLPFFGTETVQSKILIFRLIQWIPDIINVRGTTVVFLISELSYIRVLKGMKLLVRAKIRIDYKRVFLISEFLISGIHCIRFSQYISTNIFFNTIRIFDVISEVKCILLRRKRKIEIIALYPKFDVIFEVNCVTKEEAEVRK